jgi:hypothetical protein
MLRGLDENYGDWAENLMLQDLNVKTVAEAFKMRTTNSRQHGQAETSDSGPSQAAMAVTTPHPAPPSIMKRCDFCGKNGHLQLQCYTYIASKKAYRSGNSKPKEQQASHVSEFVGTAAVRLLPPSHLHHQHQLTAQLVADTGASLTMTSYCSWFLTYEPCQIPGEVHLERHSVVHCNCCR